MPKVYGAGVRTVSSVFQKRSAPFSGGPAPASPVELPLGQGGATQQKTATMGAMTTAAAHRAADLRVILVILAYAGSSLSGVFVNKACLSAYDFRYTITLMLCQLCVSVTALTILRLLRVIQIPRRSWRDMLVLLFPSVFLILNVTVGLLALRLVNIPMFSAFRRLSVLNVMVLEYFVLGKTATRRIMWTVVVMVAGSFLAGLGDLTFDPLGYFLVFLNNLITAANLVSIKKASAVVRLEALALNYYVSCIALPIVFVLALLTGELRNAVADIAIRPDLQTTGFAVALSMSAASAFLVNFFTNLCTQLTSPLTTAITGQMKNVLQTVLGIFAWGYRVSILNLSGLGVALVGSLWFAYLKYEDAMSQRASNAASSKSSEGKEDAVVVPLSGVPDVSAAALSNVRSTPGDSSAYLAAYNDDSEQVSLLRQKGKTAKPVG